MIQRLIAFLARHATAVLAIGVLAGLALPSWSAVARPALGPAVWLLLVVAVIRVDWPQIRAHLRRRALLGAAMVWMLVGAPLAMWAVLGNTALAPGLVTAMVLMAGSFLALLAIPVNFDYPVFAVLIFLNGFGGGIFTAPNTLSCLAHVFEEEKALEKLEGVLSL